MGGSRKSSKVGGIEIVSPFPITELPRCWLWISSFKNQTMDDFSPQTPEDFVQGMIQKMNSGMLTFGIEKDGELGGIVIFEPANSVNGFAHVTFKKSFFGRKTTLPALIRVANKIFELGFKKISMLVFKSNSSVISLIKDLGAKREGLLKSHTLQNGELVDCLLFRLTKEELNDQVKEAA